MLALLMVLLVAYILVTDIPSEESLKHPDIKLASKSLTLMVNSLGCTSQSSEVSLLIKK